MPADYLSRLPAFEIEKMDPVAAFDPFQPNLKDLQLKDTDLQAIFLYLKNGSWLPHLSKQQIKLLAPLAQKVFFVKNNLAWIRLDDYKYPRTALWLPEFYRKEALCESHDHLFAGHNAAQKTYIKLKIFLLLAQRLLTCLKTHPNLSEMPTTQNVKSKTTTTGTIANSGSTKYPDPCRSFWPYGKC